MNVESLCKPKRARCHGSSLWKYSRTLLVWQFLEAVCVRWCKRLFKSAFYLDIYTIQVLNSSLGWAFSVWSWCFSLPGLVSQSPENSQAPVSSNVLVGRVSVPMVLPEHFRPSSFPFSCSDGLINHSCGSETFNTNQLIIPYQRVLCQYPKIIPGKWPLD